MATRAGEALWYWLGWEPAVSTEWAEWSGPAPRLYTPDGDSSYARLNTPKATGFLEHAALAYFAPAALTDAAYSRVQVRSHDDAQHISIVLSTLDGSSQVWQYHEVPPDEWVLVDSRVWAEWAVEDGWTQDYAALTAASRTDGLCVFVAPSYFGASNRLDVSYVDLIDAVAPHPLQWRARTDGLGSSGVQPARSASTFQATGRARGMI